MHDSVCNIARCTATGECPSCHINAKAVGSVHSLFYLLDFVSDIFIVSLFSLAHVPLFFVWFSSLCLPGLLSLLSLLSLSLSLSSL